MTSSEQGGGASGWIDVSAGLYSGMVHWPDNPPVRIERELDIDRGDSANVSSISMGSHTGTHMDAPRHFIPDGMGIDQMDLSATIGRARVIEIQNESAVTEDELATKNIERGQRVLFKTRNSARAWGSESFVEDFVYISAPAAEWLAAAEVITVGVDYLSVGGFKRDGTETHRALLGAGIWIIEGMNLAQVSEGDYELICLPLKIVGGDGAPARALLRATT